ncbi:uncharacterized protein BDR25DRAFT_315354 [Lindgomyces ingoldianus]|uniref:Uncharacterized protein n=1 Tax=Lindgomyces ingoldianus TaxID=673940 RepID=A0ACB6QR21_9PLEO|nr:uncharacterized protein BDR25DRAFT_315354 [Lindgomyces ingoldianus]KAF2469335.1 hypothetical protein BDR25DRAFT_315354 [Lindgomyces ingoldianus]
MTGHRIFQPLLLKEGLKSKKISPELVEFGNIQMWQKTSYEQRLPSTSEASSSTPRPSDISRPTSAYQGSSTMSLATLSMLSNMSAVHTHQIFLGPSSNGIEIWRPEPPLLVSFLRATHWDFFSFLIIELDERMKINPTSCDYRNAKKRCNASVLHRSKKPLLARRFYATDGLNGWNLAVIGNYWSPTGASPVHVKDMYLPVNFRTESEKTKFNSEVAKLVQIFTSRMKDYEDDLQRVRTTYIATHNS